MRWLVGLGMVLLSGLGLSAQDGPTFGRAWLGALTTGTGYQPESFSQFWVFAPPQEQAVAVGQLLGIGTHPLAAGWAQVAVGDQVRAIPREGEAPISMSLLTSAPALFGGNLPFKPMQFGIPPSQSNGGMPGLSGNSGMERLASSSDSGGVPLLTTSLNLGDLGLPNQVEISLNTPQETYSASAIIPQDGWWLFTLTEADPGLMGNPLTRDVVMSPPALVTDGSNSTQGQGVVRTPEPTTISLGLLGLTAVVVLKRRRKGLSDKR